MKTERDIAIAIAAGDLPSPTVFMNQTFFACRFTAIGVAWRQSVGEFALRDRAVWLSPDMCRRIIGVPVIIDHPPGAVLDGPEFNNRVVGVVVLGFVRGDELWAIARIVDKDAAKMIDQGNFDTSPAVIFDPASNETLILPDGEKLPIEGVPALIDHLAICERGVWSKGDPDAVGIETTSNNGD